MRVPPTEPRAFIPVEEKYLQKAHLVSISRTGYKSSGARCDWL